MRSRPVHRRLLSALLCAAALAAPACAQYSGPPSDSIPQAPPPTVLTTDRTLLFPAAHDLQLSSGDLISVHLFGQPDYTPLVRIGVGGSATLPLPFNIRAAAPMLARCAGPIAAIDRSVRCNCKAATSGGNLAAFASRSASASGLARAQARLRS